MNDLSKRFHRYFDVLTDKGPAVSDAAYRLRYQVYCLETGFEDPAGFRDQRECDDFDTQSAHAVIKHRKSDADIATVRLVMARSTAGPPIFPIEQPFPDLLRQHGIDERLLPRQSTAEISRFAVSKLMKRRFTDVQATPAGVGEAITEMWPPLSDLNDRRQPLVTFGLFLALIRLSADNGITHWIAIMEPPLLRLLGRFGINFVRIGGVVEYHGRRQPCYGSVADVLQGIYVTHPDLWSLLTDGGANFGSTALARVVAE